MLQSGITGAKKGDFKEESVFSDVNSHHISHEADGAIPSVPEPSMWPSMSHSASSLDE